MFTLNRRDCGPFLLIGLVLGFTAWQLHHQGRSWWCHCRSFLWTSDAWGPQTSQTFLDPYSFTHILHGLAFCGLLALLVRNLSTIWRLVLTVVMESTWEIVENSNIIIERYRSATAALGYQGDTVVNSLGDILSCVVGFMIARRLGWRRSIFVFLATELVLTLWIRDSLLLEILMLIHPVNAIKLWQTGG